MATIKYLLFAKKEPDLNNFSPQEIHILDSVILNLHKKSAKYLSKKLMMSFGKR